MSSSLSGSDNQNAETRRAGLLSVPEKNFELMDSLYKAAVEGHTDQFRAHATMLDQILTPNENTILHIHITARPNQTMKPNNKLKSSLWRTMSTFEKQSSSSEHFVRDILEMCPGILRKANAKGETLLHIAARHGHADIVKDLIAECKKPHQNDPEKGIEAARLMLGMTNEAKDTALHEAVRYNHVDVVKILTKEDPNLPYDANKAGETPLYLAAERGYKDVMGDILSTCISPADHGPMGRTALHAAVSLEDTEMTKLLLNGKGTLTSKPDHQGCLPLHLAAHFGRHYNVKELLKVNKSAAYKADNEGKVPLHRAADRGNLDSMRELIYSCPSSCELVDGEGWNVFHFALNSESRRAVELLLENPSLRNLINEKNDDGNTPLLEHAASGSYCVKSFFLHPKVDRLAFNHQNNNIEDIFRSSKVAYQPKERLFLQYLNRYRCRRHMVFGDGERKDQGNNNVEDKKKNNDRKDKKPSRVKIFGEYVKERKDSFLAVAALIATITFTAAIAMPGVYVNEKGPDPGAAVLTRNKAFAAFVTLNSQAMILSTCAVFIHLFLLLLGNKSKELLLWQLSVGMILFSLVATLTAFLAATYSVLRVEALESIFSVICFLLLTITMHAHPLLLDQLINFIEKMLITFWRSTKEFIFPRVH